MFRRIHLDTCSSSMIHGAAFSAILRSQSCPVINFFAAPYRPIAPVSQNSGVRMSLNYDVQFQGMNGEIL